jgi:hypothetical protein
MDEDRMSSAVQEIGWHFDELRPRELERSPHEGEFFHNTNAYEALVREVVQNSLDAKTSSTCRVRFTFGHVKKTTAEKYLADLIPHLKSCLYLPDNYYSLSELNFLNIEDFGTSGLVGDTGDSGPIPKDKKSKFYDFWRREGITSKGGSEGGRWGLGKTAFNEASELHSFWGLTKREDDGKEILMGKALLKTHEVENRRYNYWGYFSKGDSKSITDSATIAAFKEAFSITRKDEPGFSLTIPLPVQGIDERTVVRSAVIHYFYPILKGMLVVEISGPSDMITLDANTLMDKARSLDWQDTSWSDKTEEEIVRLLQFAKETIQLTPNEIRTSSDQASALTEEMFGDKIDELKKSFGSGKIIAFQISMKIRRIRGTPSESFFTIYVQKDPNLKRSDEHYMRSGITICDIRQMGNRPVRGLLIAEHGAIAEFLGDCEEPAHTTWNERSGILKEKYDNAKGTLRFIKTSMSKAVSILDELPAGRFSELLADIFYIPTEISEEGMAVTEPPEIEVKHQPEVFKIGSTAGGFIISVNKNNATFPFEARVRVAYDMRRRNPFAQYDPNDFDLADVTAYKIVSKGCTIESRQKNEIKINVQDPDFRLEVAGFDQNRDLVVKVNRLEKTVNANEAQI